MSMRRPLSHPQRSIKGCLVDPSIKSIVQTILSILASSQDAPKADSISNNILDSKFASIPLSVKDLSGFFRSKAWDVFDCHNAQFIFQLSNRCEAPITDMASLKDINRMVLAKF
jgi:hypothetical protein